MTSHGLTSADVQSFVDEIKRHPEVSGALMDEIRSELARLTPGQRFSFDSIEEVKPCFCSRLLSGAAWARPRCFLDRFSTHRGQTTGGFVDGILPPKVVA